MTLVAEESDTEPDTGDRGDGKSDDASAREPTRRRDDSSTDEALAVDTVVVEERGRWAVDILVVFPDGIVRKRVDSHHTKARAELSARLIKRAAERDLRGPLNG